MERNVQVADRITHSGSVRSVDPGKRKTAAVWAFAVNSRRRFQRLTESDGVTSSTRQHAPPQAQTTSSLYCRLM